MASAEIKQAIGILCKQLNLLFQLNLKPEHLRLAKFDKTEENVVNILWKTLSFLTTKRSNSKLSVIKKCMKSINYTSPLFYLLPEDFSAGSRELLLAIGYIVATKLKHFLEEEIEKSPFGNYFNLINVNQNIETPKIPNALTQKDSKQLVMWLKGKIEQNENMSKEYELQSKKICDKFNESLNFKANGKLSLHEILALTDKRYSREFIERSSFILDLLECYQEWTKKQSIFWKWMATVLSEREQNQGRLIIR